jgi:hypothetical protein
LHRKVPFLEYNNNKNGCCTNSKCSNTNTFHVDALILYTGSHIAERLDDLKYPCAPVLTNKARVAPSREMLADFAAIDIYPVEIIRIGSHDPSRTPPEFVKPQPTEYLCETELDPQPITWSFDFAFARIEHPSPIWFLPLTFDIYPDCGFCMLIGYASVPTVAVEATVHEHRLKSVYGRELTPNDLVVGKDDKFVSPGPIVRNGCNRVAIAHQASSETGTSGAPALPLFSPGDNGLSHLGNLPSFLGFRKCLFHFLAVPTLLTPFFLSFSVCRRGHKKQEGLSVELRVLCHGRVLHAGVS